MPNVDLTELSPQYLEVVLPEHSQEGFAIKEFYVANINGRDIYDIPLQSATKAGVKEVVDKFISTRTYVALAFKHSGDGIYLVDDSGEHLSPYPRGEDKIWVKKSKFFIVRPSGDRFDITGWEFVPMAPYCQNILVLSYKVGAVPCNLDCFKAMRKE